MLKEAYINKESLLAFINPCIYVTSLSLKEVSEQTQKSTGASTRASTSAPL
jgi:hypothetical protein